jgi:hypothetical protein
MQTKINLLYAKMSGQRNKNPKNLILSLKLKYTNVATAIELAATREKLNEWLILTMRIKELISRLLRTQSLKSILNRFVV